MDSEQSFIPEPTFHIIKDQKIKDYDAAADLLTRMHSPISLEELRRQKTIAYEKGDVQSVTELDFRISSANANLRMAEMFRNHAQSPEHVSQEILATRESYLNELLPYMATGPQDVVKRERSTLVPFVLDQSVAHLLNQASHAYYQLGRVKTDKAHAQMWVHPKTLAEIAPDDRGEYQADSISTAMFDEALTAVLSAEMPDLRDLDFFTEVISNTKNKYLRNIALRKGVDIVGNFPKYVKKYSVGDRELYPSITKVYEDLTEQGLRMPKRDFLFTLPLIMKDGIVQEDLLQTAIMAHDLITVREGSGSECLYFSALVDLYDPDHPTDLTPLIELMGRELTYLNSTYFKKVLTEKNKERKQRNLPTTDRHFSLFQLKNAYQHTKKLVVATTDSESFEQISNLPEDEQREFFDTFFNESWKSLTSEEKDEFWMNGVSEVVKEVEATELSRVKDFESVLKKLSAISLVSPERLREILGTYHPSLEHLNRVVDDEQVSLFMDEFEFTERERQEFAQLRVKLGDFRLSEQEDAVRQIYKEFGDFNPFFFLADRYKHIGSNLYPAVFRDNLEGLLKEVANHIAKGDFNSWRDLQTKTITGNTFLPLHPPSMQLKMKEGPLMENYMRFWSSWNDDTTSAYAVDTSHMPSLEMQVTSTNLDILQVVNQPNLHFVDYDIWKDSSIIRTITDNADNMVDARANTLIFLDWMREDPTGTVKTFNLPLNVKDKANLAKVEKLAKAFLALSDLGDKVQVLSRAHDMKASDYADLRDLLSQLVPSKYFNASASTEDGSMAMKSIKFCKFLESTVGNYQFADYEVDVTDSSEPYDLLTAGQPTQTLINCMSYEGDPRKAAYLMDITTSRNKKVVLVRKNGRVVSRAIAKVLVDNSDRVTPIVTVEDTISEANEQKYVEQILEHLQKKFSGQKVRLGEPIYIAQEDLSLIEDILYRNRTVESLSEKERKIFNKYNRTPSQKDDSCQLVMAASTGSHVGSELMEVGPRGQPREIAENLKDKNKPMYLQVVRVIDQSPAPEMGAGLLSDEQTLRDGRLSNPQP